MRAACGVARRERGMTKRLSSEWNTRIPTPGDIVNHAYRALDDSYHLPIMADAILLADWWDTKLSRYQYATPDRETILREPSSRFARAVIAVIQCSEWPTEMTPACRRCLLGGPVSLWDEIAGRTEALWDEMYGAQPAQQAHELRQQELQLQRGRRERLLYPNVTPARVD